MLIEKIIGNIEDNNDTGAVFLDLAKAFNSISLDFYLSLLESISRKLKVYISLNQQFYFSNIFSQTERNA